MDTIKAMIEQISDTKKTLFKPELLINKNSYDENPNRPHYYNEPPQVDHLDIQKINSLICEHDWIVIPKRYNTLPPPLQQRFCTKCLIALTFLAPNDDNHYFPFDVFPDKQQYYTELDKFQVFLVEQQNKQTEADVQEAQYEYNKQLQRKLFELQERLDVLQEQVIPMIPTERPVEFTEALVAPQTSRWQKLTRALQAGTGIIKDLTVRTVSEVVSEVISKLVK